MPARCHLNLRNVSLISWTRWSRRIQPRPRAVWRGNLRRKGSSPGFPLALSPLRSASASSSANPAHFALSAPQHRQRSQSPLGEETEQVRILGASPEGLHPGRRLVTRLVSWQTRMRETSRNSGLQCSLEQAAPWAAHPSSMLRPTCGDGLTSPVPQARGRQALRSCWPERDDHGQVNDCRYPTGISSPTRASGWNSMASERNQRALACPRGRREGV